MQLRDALSDIADMKAVLDRNQPLRGFRSIAIGISAAFVLLGSFIQLHVNLTDRPSYYLDIWLCVAIASLFMTAVEMIVRGRRSNEFAVWKMHGRVIGSLMPSFVAGAIITAALIIDFDAKTKFSFCLRNMWLLPGVWSVIYSLGLFSCCKLFHRSTQVAAIYYLVAGCFYLWANWSTRIVDAWHMVAIFGVGQCLLAAILYWKVERRYGKN